MRRRNMPDQAPDLHHQLPAAPATPAAAAEASSQSSAEASTPPAASGRPAASRSQETGKQEGNDTRAESDGQEVAQQPCDASGETPRRQRAEQAPEHRPQHAAGNEYADQ
jgi:hypothetical protein